MDIMDVMLQTGLFTAILVLYLIVFKKYPKKKGHYSQRSKFGFNFLEKYKYLKTHTIM